MAFLIAETVLYTLILAYSLQTLLRAKRLGLSASTVWFVLMLLILGVRTFFSSGSELRIVATAFLFLFLGNHLAALCGKAFPRLWNISALGFFIIWLGVYPLGYANLASHMLFSLLLLFFSMVFALLKLTTTYRQTRSKAVLLTLSACLICAAAEGWDFTALRIQEIQRNFGLWVSFVFAAAMIYHHGRTEKLIALLGMRKGGETTLLSRLEQAETSLFLQNRLAAAGYLATGIAHEFKNILSQIQLCADFGISAADRESKNTSLQAIRDNVETAKRTVTSLLEQFASPGNKGPQPVKLKDMLETLRRHLSAGYRMDRIRFRLEISGNPIISTPPGELEQIVLNIVRNAANAYRFRENGRDAEIRFIVYNRDDSTVLEIRDHAGGIPANLQSSLFDPPSTGKTAGLGLFISHNLAAQSGGRLDYIPLEQGSCFRIVYPTFRVEPNNPSGNQ